MPTGITAANPRIRMILKMLSCSTALAHVGSAATDQSEQSAERVDYLAGTGDRKRGSVRGEKLADFGWVAQYGGGSKVGPKFDPTPRGVCPQVVPQVGPILFRERTNVPAMSVSRTSVIMPQSETVGMPAGITCTWTPTLTSSMQLGEVQSPGP